MSLKLTTSLSQRLVLTPQLRQRIEMLQMTTLELTDLIQQQMLENPVLEEVASQVVVGLYRASLYAPAQLFYAHVRHADLAAHIVLADSMLQEPRGFPLPIDLGRPVCTAVFGGSLQKLTETAYAEAGVPWRYFGERTTHKR